MKQAMQRGAYWAPLTKIFFKIFNMAMMVAMTFLGLFAITFLIGRVMPTDPVIAIVGDRASEAVYQAMYLELGLDQPLWRQFFIFLGNILQGDFGNSVLTGEPVLDDIKRFFPATFELAFVATIGGIIIGIPAGVLAAVKQGKWIDHIVRILGLAGNSIPIFWLGMVALLVFYAKLDWVAGPGRLEFYFDDIVETVTGIIMIDALIAGEYEVFQNALSHIILPASMLTIFSLAYISRMTRSFMLDQLNQEYVLTARVKGLSEFQVVWGHAFRNVLVQLITVIGLTFASLLEGAVLTETIFAWPGIGQYITNSLFNADMNAVIGGTLVVGMSFVGINLLSDILYRFVDPRA